jgi:hypothetical protein
MEEKIVAGTIFGFFTCAQDGVDCPFPVGRKG